VTQVESGVSEAGGRSGSAKPIGPYERLSAVVHEWDPRTVDVAARVAELVAERRPDLTVEHIGSTAVPGLPGKGIVDLSIETEPDDIPGVVEMLYGLGFGPQPGPDPWPPTRPMPVGSLELDGNRYRVHLHVQPRGGDFARDVAFRDALRNDPALRRQYEGLKRGITGGGAVEGLRYTHSKTAWILGVYRQLGFAPPPISPPATIGILGGGQLGRMLALAARALGYGVVVLDPDPLAPAAAVADRVEIGAYDDVEAAQRLKASCAVVTYELEHVGPAVAAGLDGSGQPLRPGPYPLKLTADRLAERRFVEANEGAVAAWREVAGPAEVLMASAELGYPVRLKAIRGGYDGRSQAVLDGTGAIAELDGRVEWPALLERELAFEAELSAIARRLHLPRGPPGRPQLRDPPDQRLRGGGPAPGPLPGDRPHTRAARSGPVAAQPGPPVHAGPASRLVACLSHFGSGSRARRPAGQARGATIPGVFERRATPPGGMARPGVV
jgi:GrpB-like predicted nucleotidyltransferase (UPF0157 family)